MSGRFFFNAAALRSLRRRRAPHRGEGGRKVQVGPQPGDPGFSLFPLPRKCQIRPSLPRSAALPRSAERFRQSPGLERLP